MFTCFFCGKILRRLSTGNYRCEECGAEYGTQLTVLKNPDYSDPEVRAILEKTALSRSTAVVLNP